MALEFLKGFFLMVAVFAFWPLVLSLAIVEYGELTGVYANGAYIGGIIMTFVWMYIIAPKGNQND